MDRNTAQPIVASSWRYAKVEEAYSRNPDFASCYGPNFCARLMAPSRCRLTVSPSFRLQAREGPGSVRHHGGPDQVQEDGGQANTGPENGPQPVESSELFVLLPVHLSFCWSSPMRTRCFVCLMEITCLMRCSRSCACRIKKALTMKRFIFVSEPSSSRCS